MRYGMFGEHFAWHIGALCVIAVIVGVAAIAARPERVYR
jgi:hypothetical protein